MLSDTQARGNLAENLSRLLRDRDISQRSLSVLSDVPLMTINSIVNEKHMPGVGVVARIAEAFDVSIDRLVGPPPEKNISRRG